MRFFARRICTVLMLLGLCSGPVLGQVRSLVGKMIAIDGPSTSYVVRRQDALVPVTFNMAFLNGDTIEVLKPDQSMKIRYVDGKDDKITKANSPFLLKPRAPVTDATSNQIRALWKNVTKSHDDGLATHAVRDNDRLALDMPGLSDKTARITAGDRHFMLLWNGGRPPYQVIVRNSRNEILVDEKLPQRQLLVSSRTIAFVQGTYTIELSTQSERVLGGFEAVSSGTPQARLLKTDPEGAVLAAEELATSGDRALLYEAYLQLFAGIRARYDLAQALGEYLANGAP